MSVQSSSNFNSNLVMGAQDVPTSFHNYRVSILNQPTLAHNNISLYAQESMNEIQKLRILLKKLFTSSGVEESEELDDVDKLGNDVPNNQWIRSSGIKLVGNISSPACLGADVQVNSGSLDNNRNAFLSLNSNMKSGNKLTLHKLVCQISEVFYTLDQLANRMHSSRLSSRTGDLGIQNALSLFNTVDQLEFSRNLTLIDSQLPDLSDKPKESSYLRRIDWLNDRLEAERWSHRYWERTHTVLEGLLACSAFRRSHTYLDSRHRKLSYIGTSINREYRPDFEYLMNDLQCNLPDLTINIIGVRPITNVVHVKVGEVMQCFVIFRQLNPERIIIRGITERMVINTNHCWNTLDGDLEEQSLYHVNDEFVDLTKSAELRPQVKDFILNLTCPESIYCPTYLDSRTQKTLNHKRIKKLAIDHNKLDLFTPSDYILFKRITMLAQCALLHFSNEYKPPSAVRGFFYWLHSYRDLFNAPCARCGQLLGKNAQLPLWRTYPQLRKEDSMEPQHEQCQANF